MSRGMLENSLSPRRKAQEAINEINYGVSELIDIRMNITENVQKMTTFEIQEAAVEESANEKDRMKDVADFAIQPNLAESPKSVSDCS